MLGRVAICSEDRRPAANSMLQEIYLHNCVVEKTSQPVMLRARFNLPEVAAED